MNQDFLYGHCWDLRSSVDRANAWGSVASIWLPQREESCERHWLLRRPALSCQTPYHCLPDWPLALEIPRECGKLVPFCYSCKKNIHLLELWYVPCIFKSRVVPGKKSAVSLNGETGLNIRYHELQLLSLLTLLTLYSSSWIRLRILDTSSLLSSSASIITKTRHVASPKVQSAAPPLQSLKVKNMNHYKHYITSFILVTTICWGSQFVSEGLSGWWGRVIQCPLQCPS